MPHRSGLLIDCGRTDGLPDVRRFPAPAVALLVVVQPLDDGVPHARVDQLAAVEERKLARRIARDRMARTLTTDI